MAGSSIYSDILKNIADMKKLAAHAPGEIGRALKEVADELVPECKAVTPVADRTYGNNPPGTLRDEIHSEGPIQDGKTIIVKIKTGPKSATYAAVQHEDLDFFHSVGEAKYIERPLGKASRFIKDRVARKIQMGKAL
jgi:hypothetical protein